MRVIDAEPESRIHSNHAYKRGLKRWFCARGTRAQNQRFKQLPNVLQPQTLDNATVYTNLWF
jgi:hypothetical protein